MKDLLKKTLSSRTILVLMFLVVFNSFSAVSQAIDPTISAIINSVFLTIAGYFRINTSVKFDE